MRMRMKQSGFTLLEVLVAVLVLAIGLLGLAGLMTASVRNNQSAYQRTQATWLAYDIVDRMRVDRAAALASNYNTALGSPAICAATPVLAGATMAANELTDWKNQVACALPAGDGAIAVQANRSVTITVQWNDSRGIGQHNTATGNAGNSTQQFTIQTRL
ncbi:MAG: type IV pilus modification protein PilV [Hydrogenophilales bacterium 12-64-6]|nr:MAG: type IV pilus modification protein PilV [Hydrogenophilales bacterium 12-64-6]